MKILGTIAVLLFLFAIFRIYHEIMKEVYREEMQKKLNERFQREIDFRWKNQNVRVHSRLVITDEMHGR